MDTVNNLKFVSEFNKLIKDNYEMGLFHLAYFLPLLRKSSEICGGPYTKNI